MDYTPAEQTTARKYDWRNHIGETHKDGTPHVANPQSIALADGEPSSDDRLIFDIWCVECGQSGSFSIAIDPDSGDIQWA